MNSKRTLARERRLAAVHEAGHVVIARRVGFKTAAAWITMGGRMQKTKERGQAAFKLKACAWINSLAAWLALPAPLQNIQYLDHEPSGLLWGLRPRRLRGLLFWQEPSSISCLCLSTPRSTDCAAWIGLTISGTKRPCTGN
jgi:Zn-dependent protease